MGEGFAGVNLDEALSKPEEQVSEPKGEESVVEHVDDGKEAQKSQTSDLTDLEKLERFRFNGREMTPKELKDSFMMRSDYTKKTQELSETRKYAENFHADLKSVVGNPRLLDEMKKVYPPEYVQITEQILSLIKSQPDGQGKPQSSDPSLSLPKEVLERLEKVDRWENQMREQSTQAMLEQIDSLHERMAKKYPYADSDVVDRRIEVAIDRGLVIKPENLAQIYENAYKMHHNDLKSRLDSQAKQKVEEQVNAGKKARDIGAGGSVPQNAPKKYKKFSEITKDVLKSLDG